MGQIPAHSVGRGLHSFSRVWGEIRSFQAWEGGHWTVSRIDFVTLALTGFTHRM